MAVIVKIPSPLRSLAGGHREVTIDGVSIREVLENMDAIHNGLKARLCGADGTLHRFINMYVNDVDIRSLDGLDSEVSDGDVVSIIPAIAGGFAPTSQEWLSENPRKGWASSTCSRS